MLQRLLDWLRAPDLGPASYRLTRRVFLTLLGLVYLAAFASLWVQVQGLIGSRGIDPAFELLERASASLGAEAIPRIPTLLWLWSDDAALHALCAAGVAFSLLLAVGVAPRLCAAALWLAYLSLVSVGSVFLRYQWDALLLETGLLAILFAPSPLRPAAAARAPVDRIGLGLLRFLLFKLIFLSGMLKLGSGDPTWQNLTALQVHYLTQPLPTWTSWYAHQLPGWLHSVSALLTLAFEIVLPWLIFAPRRARWLACAGLAGLQLLILASGSYGFFNGLTLALCVLLLDDASLRRLLPARWRPGAGASPDAPLPPRVGWRRGLRGVYVAFALLLFALSAVRLLDALGAGPQRPGWVAGLERRLAPFASINAYGLFAVMTTQRLEIEVEGSTNAVDWRPYTFRWKPGPEQRAPRFAGAHLPRVDWQMWFAVLRGCSERGWFPRFQKRLLEGEPSVLALLDGNPFPEAPPVYLRTTVHRYEFAPPGADAWWTRSRLGLFCPVVTQSGGRLVRVRSAF